jgi:hypothetical protein
LEEDDEAGSRLDPCALEDAAIAGILFSVLLIAGLLLFRLSVRADPLEASAYGIIEKADVMERIAGSSFLRLFDGSVRIYFSFHSRLPSQTGYTTRTSRFEHFKKLV